MTGLWHGAAANYIIWGLYYGMFLLIEKFIIGKRIEKIPLSLRHTITLIIIIIGWVIFRLENFSDLLSVLKNMIIFKQSDWLGLIQSNAQLFVYLPYLIFDIIFSLPIGKIFINKINEKQSCWLTLIEDLILGILFCFVIVKLVSNSYNPFIYFRF